MASLRSRFSNGDDFSTFKISYFKKQNLSSGLSDSLARSPVDDVKIDEGVEGEKYVRGRDHEEENRAEDHIMKLLRMQEGRREEDGHHCHNEH